MRLPGAILVFLLTLSAPLLAQLNITTNSSDLTGVVNQPYNKQLMATGGSGSYQWGFDGMLPPGVNSKPDGSLSGTPTATGNFSFTAVVSDQQTQQSTFKQLTIVITQTAPVTITTPSPLPGADANSQYNVTFTATGGKAPYHWLLSGSIDPGLSFDPNAGSISGKPVAANVYKFSVQAIDSASAASPATPFTLTVNPALGIVDSSPLPSRTVGIQFALALRATGGDQAYKFSVQTTPFNQNPLPPGVNLSAGGVLSGTPTQPGTYNFTVILMDGTNSQFFKAFTETINGPVTITTGSALPAAAASVKYSQKIDVTGGTPPLTFFPLNFPSGLTIDQQTGILSWPSPGPVNTYTFDVEVRDSQNASDRKTFQLPVTPGPPKLLVSPLSLDFNAAVQGDSPVPQELDISALAAEQTSYSISIDGGAGVAAAVPWLIVKQLAGFTPARIVVSVDQGSMPAGKSFARIKVTDASQNTMFALVTLTLTNVAPQLQLVPDEVDVAALVEAPGDFERVIGVRNAGGGGSISFGAALAGRSSWVTTVTPSSGQTQRNSLVFVRVRFSTQGVGAGSYREELGFTSAGGNPVAVVKLFVAEKGPIVSTNVTGVRLQARQGGGFSRNPTIKVLNIGDPAITLAWTAEVVTGSDIVSLGVARGTATASMPGDLPIILKPGATSMAAGGYYALIRILNAQSPNQVVYVIVVFDLASDTTLPVPDPFPVALLFIATANGPNPSAQTLSVNTSSAPIVAFESGASTSDGSMWLSATPSVGTASGQFAGLVTARVSIAGLAPGIYIGEVAISISGVVRTVVVVLIVLPPGVAPPVAGAAAAPCSSPAASCTPGKLALTQTGLINNFSVPAKWPATLIAQLNDDCGALVNGGSVAANFSNGDPTLTLRGDGQSGTYSATWQPGVVSPQMTVTLQAEAGSLQPATAQLIGGVNQNVAPVLFKNGTVNVFNRVPAGALAPGMIVEVYGSGLASPTATPSMLPLPIAFNNTFVLVGPYQAPLYYLSDGQLDAQINAELGPNQQYPIVVSANGKLTVPQMVDVAPVQLGIAHYDDGHSDSPAKPNEVLVMYLSGMGPTNPAVKSGDPAPGGESLAHVTLTPTVMLDGQMAKLEFAGLTPGFVGLYQVNFDVPGNARTGDLDLVVIQNGVSSNTTKLPVSK